MRAAIYARISRDRTGAGLGVERQAADCRELCERKSWKVVKVYCDNDISAFSRKRRPDWDRLWADVAAGEIDAVVAWHQDRMTRTPRELEDVIDLSNRYGTELATRFGDIDTTSSNGRLHLRITGDVARHESELKAERVRDQKRQSAEKGEVSGGGYRAYGYERNGKTVVPEEAAIVRELAARLLAGESQNSVARDLAARGVKTTTGRGWTPQSVVQTMTGVRISGRREHKGEVMGEAVWPAIISVEDSDRLRLMMRNRPKPKPSIGTLGTPRKYLLSGLLRCGKCGRALVGKPKNDTPKYVCRKLPGTPGCGGVTTSAVRTDEMVRQMVLTALVGEDFAAMQRAKRNASPELLQAVEADRNLRDELAAMLGRGEIGMSEWQAARAPIEARLATNERLVAASTGPDPLGAFTGSYSQMWERWGSMNNSRRRAVVDAVVEKIVVHPSNDRGAGRKDRFDPNRFEVVWRA